MPTDKRQPTSEEVEQWFEEETGVLAPANPQDPAEKYSKSQLRVVRETKDYQLDYLRHTLSAGRQIVDTAPAYQRRLRWDRKKRSLLIESFLLNIPVPPVYLFEREYNAYEVIDGRQRLEAISAFLANDFALVGLEYWPELNGKRYNNLPSVLKQGLGRRSLQAVVLLAETQRGEGALDVRRLLFDRLNTGGVKLNPQELRNALHPGQLNHTLEKLARSEPFTTAWGIPPWTPEEETEGPPPELADNTLFKTMADVELVLRFFALRDAIVSRRTGSLRRILDRYMEEEADASPGRLVEMDSEFQSLMHRLVELFEGDPFVLPENGRLSRPLYDALMIALSLHPGLDLSAKPEVIRTRLAAALGNPDTYDVLVGRGNTIKAVRDRVDLAGHILSGE